MKAKKNYTCQSCGAKSPSWLGRCPECQEWNSFIEEIENIAPKGRVIINGGEKARPTRLKDIKGDIQDRVHPGINELDRGWGGGVVPGSLVLIGGDPGIGKSTIMLQVSLNLSDAGEKILYISGEESKEQVRGRAERIGEGKGELYILCETYMEEIIPHIDQIKPTLIVIDSIQTLYTSQIESSPGSVGQVREVTAQLLQISKKRGIPIFLIGHVTKDGAIAGPKILEHMVDTVLYFEGERSNSYRILRAVKNRFGPVNEIGVFEMDSAGLKEVTNPSALFLSDRPTAVSGSLVTAAMEGTRPILVEIQGLATPSNLGMARRNVIGTDSNRVSLLIAILEKRIGIHLTAMDIFINVVGGMNISEPSADLAIMAVLVSSAKDIPVDPETIVMGEVGLSGEVRSIPQADLRIAEASKLGFKRCILPKKGKGNYKNKGMELLEVSTVSECIEYLFKGVKRGK